MDLTTDIDAFYKVRKFVGGVEHGQNFTRWPGPGRDGGRGTGAVL